MDELLKLEMANIAAMTGLTLTFLRWYPGDVALLGVSCECGCSADLPEPFDKYPFLIVDMRRVLASYKATPLRVVGGES